MIKGIRQLAVATTASILAMVFVTIEPAAATQVYSVTTTADVVSSTDGVLSLREAFTLANSDGDGSIIQLQSGQTYTLSICAGEGEDANLSGDLDHNEKWWLMIEGIGKRPTIDTVCGDRHIDNRTGAFLGVRNVRLINGNADLDTYAFTDPPPEDVGGGSIESLGPVYVLDALFTDNVAQHVGVTQPHPSALGGAISANRVWALQSGFSRNIADDGGAIGNRFSEYTSPPSWASTVYTSSSTYSSNTATLGGAIFARELTMYSSKVGNNDGAIGGGVAATNGSISNSKFGSNSASYWAGDAYVIGSPGNLSVNGDETPFVISGSTFDGASAAACGSVYSNHLRVTSSTIRNAAATWSGGGVCIVPVQLWDGWSSPGSITMSNSVVADNSSGGSGGGLVVGGVATIDGSLITKNHAAGDGGGIDHYASQSAYNGDIQIRRSQFDANTAGLTGGGLATDGVYWSGGVAGIENTTFSQNSSVDSGAGVSVWGGLTLTHNTFFRNASEIDSGAAIANQSTDGTLRLRANAIAGQGNDCLLPEPVVSLGRNTDTDLTCGLSFGTGDLPGWTFLAASPSFTVLGVSAPTQSEAWLANWIPAPQCTLPIDQLGTSRPSGSGCTPGAIEIGKILPNDDWPWMSTEGDVVRTTEPIGDDGQAFSPERAPADAAATPTDRTAPILGQLPVEMESSRNLEVRTETPPPVEIVPAEFLRAMGDLPPDALSGAAG